MAKIARTTNFTKFYTLKEKRPRRASVSPQISQKSKKQQEFFMLYVKRLSNKYGKNSKNNKFHKILHFEREKAKKGFSKSANFAKIEKATRIFHAICEKIEQQIWQK